MVILQLKNDKWFTFTIVQFVLIDELSMIWLFNAIFNNIQLNRGGVFNGWWRKPESTEKTPNLPQTNVNENLRGNQEWMNQGHWQHWALNKEDEDKKHKTTHTHNTHNTTQKAKRMSNTGSTKNRTEPRYCRRVSKSCLL